MIHASMSNEKCNDESGALLSFAVGDGARNMHNEVLDIADGSNPPWGRRSTNASCKIDVDALVVPKCGSPIGNFEVFRLLQNHKEMLQTVLRQYL